MPVMFMVPLVLYRLLNCPTFKAIGLISWLCTLQHAKAACLKIIKHSKPATADALHQQSSSRLLPEYVWCMLSCNLSQRQQHLLVLIA
jgi:hypothetical protein